MRRDDPVYPMGVAARLCGVHPQTLRAYERQGLVKPKRVCEKNRMYSAADIERIRRIQRLTQELGVNLAGVDIILRLIDDFEQMSEEFEKQFTELQEEMDVRLEAALRNANAPIPADMRRRVVRFVRPKRLEL